MAHGLVKTLDDGNGGKLKLVGSAYTFIIYKNYFGRDLLNDIVSFAKKNATSDAVRKLAEFGSADVKSLTAEQQAAFIAATGEFKFDSEFILQFVAALITTARYPEKPDIVDVIMEIPPHWLADQGIVSELMEFLSLFISAKKGGTAANSGNSFRG
jgi:hypothetical protein